MYRKMKYKGESSSKDSDATIPNWSGGNRVENQSGADDHENINPDNIIKDLLPIRYSFRRLNEVDWRHACKESLPDVQRNFQTEVAKKFGSLVSGKSESHVIGASLQPRSNGNKYNWHKVVQAYKFQDQKILERAIDGGYDFDKTKLLHAIVNEGNTKCVKTLLGSRRADVNVRDEHGRTPLFYALFNKDKPMMELLIDNNADVNIQDNEGMTVALFACAFGMPSFLDCLMPRAKLAMCNKVGRSILHYAAVQGTPSFVKQVLPKLKERGQLNDTVNATDARKETPLHLAALAKREENIKLLLENGADPSIQCDSLTPVHYSAFLWDTRSLRHFIETGDIDVTMQDRNKRTLLHHAVKKDPWNNIRTTSQADCVQYLTQLKSIEIDQPDETNETALGYAARYDSNLVRLLISEGANPNGAETLSSRQTGATKSLPLLIAAEHNQLESVRLLLPYSSEETKNTALLIATENENVAIVETLLQNNANPCIRNKQGKNLFEIAAVGKSNPILAFLIAQYATINTEDGGYEIDLDAVLPQDNKRPATELVYKINNTFKDHYRNSIFTLPVVRAFVDLQIRRLRLLEMASVILTVCFLGTVFLYFFKSANCIFKNTKMNGGTETADGDSNAANETIEEDSFPVVCHSGNLKETHAWYYCLVPLIIKFLSLLIALWRGYRIGSILSCFCYLEAGLEIFIASFAIVSNPFGKFLPESWQRALVVVAMLACGLDFSLVMGRMLSFFHGQIVMFRLVLKKALLLLLPFLPLLACFFIATHVTMEEDKEYRSLSSSVMKTLTFIVGNIETTLETNENIDRNIAYAIVVFTFVFLICVVMMNLLIGLAVNIGEEPEDDYAYLATKRRISNIYLTELMFYNITECFHRFTNVKQSNSNGETKIKIFESKTSQGFKGRLKRLKFWFGCFGTEKKWPMKWMGINKKDMASIPKRKINEQKNASCLLQTIDCVDCTLGIDMEIMEMILSQLFQKLQEIEARVVN